MKRLLLFVGVFLFFLPSYAQFSLEGDLRPKAEFRHGYRRMPYESEDPAGHVSQRTRLIFGFSQDRVITRVSIQDVRIWGDQPPLNDVPSIDLHEAWIQLALTEKLFVRAGRQEIHYDNQRLFAINDWNNVANKHDAVVVGYQATSGELHIGAAFNQSGAPLFGTHFQTDHYKTLNYFRYKTGLAEGIDISLMGVADGYESNHNPDVLYMRGTWSAFVSFESGPVSIHVNPAWQHGRNSYGNPIRASYFMLEASAMPFDGLQTNIGLEWLSGNDFENLDETFRAFDPLYGAGHAVHGYMDYFTNTLVHTRGAGLVNPYLKNSIKLSEKTSLDADLHLFFLQNNYPRFTDDYDIPLESLNKYLGTEVDFTLSHRFDDITRLMLGYSVMFGTESMEAIKGGSKDEFSHWAFVMLRVRPRFL